MLDQIIVGGPGIHFRYTVEVVPEQFPRRRSIVRTYSCRTTTTDGVAGTDEVTATDGVEAADDVTAVVVVAADSESVAARAVVAAVVDGDVSVADVSDGTATAPAPATATDDGC